MREGGGGADEFARGFLDAGGDPAILAHVTDVIIGCEHTSGWEWEAGNGYLSVAQFAPLSWARAGGGDPRDLRQVGGNVARWIGMIADPGGSGGWPVCWHRGGW